VWEEGLIENRAGMSAWVEISLLVTIYVHKSWQPDLSDLKVGFE